MGRLARSLCTGSTKEFRFPVESDFSLIAYTLFIDTFHPKFGRYTQLYERTQKSETYGD